MFSVVDIVSSDSTGLRRAMEFVMDLDSHVDGSDDWIRRLEDIDDSLLFGAEVNGKVVALGHVWINPGNMLTAHVQVTSNYFGIVSMKLLVARVQRFAECAAVGNVLLYLQDPGDEDVDAWTQCALKKVGERSEFRRRICTEDLISVPPVDGVSISSLATRIDLEKSAHAAWCSALATVTDEHVGPMPSFANWKSEIAGGKGDDIPASVMVAVANDEVVGIACLHVGSPDSREATHQFTGVVPAWRGRGIASGLKASLAQWAAENGIDVLRTSVLSSNQPMRHVNARLGYQATGAMVIMNVPMGDTTKQLN